MENVSTPIPLPNLNILKASDLNDKKSSLKKQLRSCPHVPDKSLYRPLFCPSPRHPSLRKTGHSSLHTSVNSRKQLIHSPGSSTKSSNDSYDSSDKCEELSTPNITDSDYDWSPWLSTDLRATYQMPRLVSFTNKTDDGILLNAEEQTDNDDVIRGIKFELIEKLGSGSFGEVYKVRELSSRKLFAIKKSRERFRGANDRKRKLEEVRRMETMGRHDNCVRFFKAWEENLFLFIQTELCHTTLSKLISESEDQHLEEEETWFVLGDMLNALTHLSARNLVHLDIKPANIFLQPPIYKLGDFGLMIDTTDEIIDPQEGDPKYLALEVLSEVYTSAADIFSLGATLLDCVTSIDLPRSGHWWRLLRESLNNLPNEFLKQMSPELSDVVGSMMSKDHNNRPSAEQLLSNPDIQHRTSIRRKRREEFRSLHAVLSDLGASPMKRIRLDSSSSSCGETNSPKREKQKMPPFLRPEKEMKINSRIASLGSATTARMTSSGGVVCNERPTATVVSDEIEFSMTFPIGAEENNRPSYRDCGDRNLVPYSSFSCLVTDSSNFLCSSRNGSSEDDSGIAGHSSTDKSSLSQHAGTYESSPEQEGAVALSPTFSSSNASGSRKDAASPSSIVTPTSSPRLRSGSIASSGGFRTPHSLRVSNSNKSGFHQISTAISFVEVPPRKCTSSSSSGSVGSHSESCSGNESRTSNIAGSDLFGCEDDVFTSSNIKPDWSATIKDNDWPPTSVSAEHEVLERLSPIMAPEQSGSKKRPVDVINFQAESDAQFQPIVFESPNL